MPIPVKGELHEKIGKNSSYVAMLYAAVPSVFGCRSIQRPVHHGLRTA